MAFPGTALHYYIALYCPSERLLIGRLRPEVTEGPLLWKPHALIAFQSEAPVPGRVLGEARHPSGRMALGSEE